MTLQEAIQERNKYETAEAYIEAHRSEKDKHLAIERLPKMAWLFDEYMKRDQMQVIEPQPKPLRPANYKLLDEYWQLVTLETDFNSYPVDSIVALVEKEALFFVADN